MQGEFLGFTTVLGFGVACRWIGRFRFHLTVSGYGCDFAAGGIFPESVPVALAFVMAAVGTQVALKIE